MRSPASAVNRATIAPASSTSSRVILPPVPAHIRSIRGRSAHRPTTADRLTRAASQISSAARACSIARVPLVVVKTSVFAADCSGVYSRGELPRSKSVDSHAPALSSQDSLAGRQVRGGGARVVDFEARNHLAAPAARAAVMVVVARSTSITTDTPPANSPGATNCGRKWARISLSYLCRLELFWVKRERIAERPFRQAICAA